MYSCILAHSKNHVRSRTLCGYRARTRFSKVTSSSWADTTVSVCVITSTKILQAGGAMMEINAGVSAFSWMTSFSRILVMRLLKRLFCTVGCHPTRCNEFESSGNPDEYLESLSNLIKTANGKVVAVGETGLDYDRLQFCSKDVQKKYFESQLKLSKLHNLPLFFHNRNTGGDFIEILQKHEGELPGGVVHSFDGSLEDMESIIKLGFCIGINGCSLKTPENLEVVKQIPQEKLLLETDCPWCEVRPTHAGFPFIKTKFDAVKKEKWSPNSMVKSRNEPATIVQILEIVAAIRNQPEADLCEAVYNNTVKLFFSK